MLRRLGQSSQDRWAQRRAVTANLKLFQKHSRTLLGRAASLLWPASLSLLAPQGSWNAGHQLGAWACLRVTLVSRHLCPHHAHSTQGPSPDE